MTTQNEKTGARPGASQSAPTAEIIPAGQRSQMLYRKWRSQTFDELVGQDAITRTLQNAITAGRVGHAYLFCGPRGTGKTSTGRLLAKAINCLNPDPKARPCDKCEACRSITEARALDLIEIDAASNRGIDEVRELRDKINFQPSFLRKKVYIIDEAHMMTEAAFNALLKTLEEPPPHAVFVLATTDPQDIPATVVSRCQRFDFQRISLDQIVARLAFICGEENIPVETAALEMVARQATGSLRDALSLLDQLIVFSGGTITLEAVRLMLGVMNIEAVADFADALAEGDIASGLEQINRLMQAGTDLKRFNRELVEHLRNLMLLKVNPHSRELADMTAEAQERLQEQAARMELGAIVNFLKVFSGVDYNLKVSPYGQLPLEIALMECLLRPAAPAVAPVREQSAAPRPAALREQSAPAPVSQPRPAVAQPARTVAQPSVPTSNGTEPKTKETAQPPAETQPVAAQSTDGEEKAALELPAVLQAWKQVQKNIEAKKGKTTAAILKEANPVEIKGNRIMLAFNYNFHYKKISQDIECIRLMEDDFASIFGQVVTIKCLDQSAEASSARPAEATNGSKSASKDDERTRRAAQLFNARIVD